jgi:cyanophycin synthetase
MKKLQKFLEFHKSIEFVPNTDVITIRDIKLIDGENNWSETRTKLVHMVLDLGGFEEFPSNKIPNFYESISRLLPSLYTHRCSVGIPGGFLSRIKEGTWLGHIIEHVALELQTLAGMDTGWGRTRGVKGEEGVYNVVFNYTNPNCGQYVAIQSVKIVKDVINQLEPDIGIVIEKVKQLIFFFLYKIQWIQRRKKR